MKAVGLVGLAAVLVFLFGCTNVPLNCINVTCNGVTSCRAPDNIPPCVPPIPANSTGTVAVSLAQELNNSAEAGFGLDAGMFHANSATDCSRQLISPCDNNVPDQFVCVNQRYAGTVSSQYAGIYQTPRACPQFLLAGSVYCGLDNDYCVVVEEGPNQENPA